MAFYYDKIVNKNLTLRTYTYFNLCLTLAKITFLYIHLLLNMSIHSFNNFVKKKNYIGD